MPINALTEVMESEGFITLDAQSAAVLVRQEKELATYAMRARDFNHLATSKRVQKAFCLAMYEGARGFIAQIGIVGYRADQAVVDALTLYTDDLTSPFNVNTDGFLRAYRDSCKLVSLPVSTTPYNFENVLHNLNNPPQPNNGEIVAAQALANAAAANAVAATVIAANAAANGLPEAVAAAKAPKIAAPAAATALPYAAALLEGHRFDPHT